MNYEARIDQDEAAPLAGEVGHGTDPLDQSGEEDSRANRRMWIVLAVVAVLLVGVWFIAHRGGADDGAISGDSQAPVVSVITPGKATVAGKVDATATLAARRELPVGVAGEGGQVVQVLVEPGEWVAAGQVLAVIDRSVQVQQTSSMAAQIQVAQADARLAQANLDRALRLVDRGFISKADIDRLTATRDAAAARVRVAGAQLGEMQARVRRLDIVAPAAGLVLERNIEPGQVVSSGSGVLFSLAKGGEMEALAPVGEVDLARLSLGGAAVVTPVGGAKAFTGQIWQLSPVINPQTRQGTARVALAYAPELRPGGFASVAITSGSMVAPLLPESAILSDNKGSFVYIVGKDNKVARRDIKVGDVTENGVIVASGLTGQERVVLRAGAFLAPGETVKPRAER